MAHFWDAGTWKAKSSAGLFVLRTNPLLREIDRLVEAYHVIPLIDADSFVRRTAYLAAIFSRTGARAVHLPSFVASPLSGEVVMAGVSVRYCAF